MLYLPTKNGKHPHVRILIIFNIYVVVDVLYFNFKVSQAHNQLSYNFVKQN